MPGEVSSKAEQRLRWALQLLCALFLLWLYPGDLLRLVRAQFAEVTVMHELPSLPLSLVGTAVAIGFTVTLFMAARQPPGWRPRRLAVIAAVLLIFVDFLVLASRRTMELPELELASVVVDMTGVINRASTMERVPTDGRAFEKELDELGPVPLFVKGERVEKWTLEVRRNCTGPATTPGAPGALIYCVSPDATRGWLTLTATERAVTFGAPGVVSLFPPWVGDVTVVAPRPPEPAEDTVWEPPTQDEEP